MSSSPAKVFTARFPVGYHFTVRPFAVTSWTIRGTNEGILKSILFTGLVPTKSSTFAVPSILPRPDYRCGFIYRGASYGMGILFVGKNARGAPGDQYQDFQSGFRASRDWLWQKPWPYWRYTRKISENIYGDDSIENIAFTNIVKCNDSMGRDTTSSFTKNHCIYELNVIGREIAIIDPTHIVFYTSWGYDDYIQHIFDGFEIVKSAEIAIGRKKMPWLEAKGVCGGKNINILRAGHPERMKKADYVSAICRWVLSAE